ncbi:pollen-specific protein C13 [Hordeum vulgare]|nr:pollen-specific protein C13 [Hordeum vulgare]
MASLRASLLLAAVLCALAASSATASRGLHLHPTQFVVRGRVWCDTCRAGFETPASTFIAGTYAASAASSLLSRSVAVASVSQERAPLGLPPSFHFPLVFFLLIFLSQMRLFTHECYLIGVASSNYTTGM